METIGITWTNVKIQNANVKTALAILANALREIRVSVMKKD